jgi:predicted HAD superfamily phosphohydrolase
MKQILKLCMTLDKVKIGLDEDDNLLVRIDLNTRTLDKEELTQSLDQLGGATDEVFAIVPRKSQP